MLELIRTTVSVVTAVASSSAIDVAMAAPGTYRVAPDELMMVGEPDTVETALGRLAAEIDVADPDALVMDASDGWAVWSLRGDATRRAFTYLSRLELPDEGFIQGDVAHVPVRVIVAKDLVHLLVPAMWGACLHDRVLERCRPLQIREASETTP